MTEKQVDEELKLDNLLVDSPCIKCGGNDEDNCWEICDQYQIWKVKIYSYFKSLFKQKARECVPEKRRNVSPAVNCIIDETLENIDLKFK